MEVFPSFWCGELTPEILGTPRRAVPAGFISRSVSKNIHFLDVDMCEFLVTVHKIPVSADIGE